ncbi:hypothetical protein LTR86_010425 [Recurvomyces mirabilis]|nr:hypothetical protein LTR86_010425 [Recurvomyces mirabilis]
MEVSSIYELVEVVFGGAGSARARLFITCTTREEILVITDRRPHTNSTYPTYTNVFIPTICRSCAGYRRDGTGDFELSEGFVQRSDAFEAVRDFCGEEVQFMRHVERREVILQECHKCGIYIRSAQLVTGNGGAKELELLPYYDPSFV